MAVILEGGSDKTKKASGLLKFSYVNVDIESTRM
jgi:hypothetical protein